MSEIDFVITWVDGSDENWREKKREYVKERAGDEVYYRDWGLLRYLFRSIEKYAPWVRRIYLVTDGQVPRWLDTNHKKIVVTDHRDFIPAKYLPTFNSHTIELNLHRIRGLGEQFVYFNDDILLTKHCQKSDFFINGQPADEGTLNGINGRDEIFAEIQFHNISLMNRYYSVKDCRRNIFKWVTPGYGKNVCRTLLLLPFQRLQGIYNPHGPMPVLKSTCQKLWSRDFDILDRTCRCREREADNVSAYIYRYEQLLSGNFVPHKSSNGYFDLGASAGALRRGMQRYKSICINDIPMNVERSRRKQKEIQKLMEQKYPDKSSFEKSGLE